MEKLRDMAIRINANRYIRAGWKLEEGGYLSKGQVSVPLQSLGNLSAFLRHPGDPQFNPRTDPGIVRFDGAKFVSPKRYYLPDSGQYCDQNGALVVGPEEECFECGGMPWHVRTKESLPPFAPAWEWNYTYCRRCVTPEEIADLKRRQEEARLTETKPKWGRRS